MRALPLLLILLTINLVLALVLYRQQAAWTPVAPLDPAVPRLVLLSELPGAPSAPVAVPVEPTPGEPLVTGIPDAVAPAPGTLVSAVPDPTPVVPTPPPAAPPMVVTATPDPVPTAVAPVAADPEPVAIAPVPEPPPPPLRCLRLVGFGDQLAAQRAQRRLQPQVEKAELQVRTVRNVRNYWVYLPPAANRPAALETSRRLGEKGLSDYFVTTTGTNPNAISLGVFSTRANAERRQQQIVNAGFEAQIAERAEETRIHDLDLHWRSADPLDWAKALPDFRGLRAEPLNCPSGA